eukprot:m.273201 g.273201  ORF g.273201 m.273201 type:complete len:55 (+) comp61915_c0_seq1:206-370(+)
MKHERLTTFTFNNTASTNLNRNINTISTIKTIIIKSAASPKEQKRSLTKLTEYL